MKTNYYLIELTDIDSNQMLNTLDKLRMIRYILEFNFVSNYLFHIG